MCMTVDRNKKRRMVRTAWKVVQFDRNSVLYEGLSPPYEKGNVVRADMSPKSIREHAKKYGNVENGIHVYLTERMAKKSKFYNQKVIKLAVDPKDWVATGDGRAVYTKVKVVS